MRPTGERPSRRASHEGERAPHGAPIHSRRSSSALSSNGRFGRPSADAIKASAICGFRGSRGPWRYEPIRSPSRPPSPGSSATPSVPVTSPLLPCPISMMANGLAPASRTFAQPWFSKPTTVRSRGDRGRPGLLAEAHDPSRTRATTGPTRRLRPRTDRRDGEQAGAPQVLALGRAISNAEVLIAAADRQKRAPSATRSMSWPPRRSSSRATVTCSRSWPPPIRRRSAGGIRFGSDPDLGHGRRDRTRLGPLHDGHDVRAVPVDPKDVRKEMDDAKDQGGPHGPAHAQRGEADAVPSPVRRSFAGPSERCTSLPRPRRHREAHGTHRDRGRQPTSHAPPTTPAGRPRSPGRT